MASQTSQNVYYTITRYNNPIESRYIPAAYTENRITPLIYDQENYKIEIVKFIVPTSSIPLFSYKGNNRGKVALTYAGNHYPITVELTDADSGTTPKTPQTIINND